MFFKGCIPQILLGPFLNTLSHILLDAIGLTDESNWSFGTANPDVHKSNSTARQCVTQLKYKEYFNVASIVIMYWEVSFSCSDGIKNLNCDSDSALEAVVQKCYVKKVFLEISQNSQ